MLNILRGLLAAQRGTHAGAARAAFACLLILLGLQWACVPRAHAEQTKPNIVWIFVEDMNGWYGCYGDGTVPTPHIDAIAARGVRFTRAYMPAGVCSATRSAIALGAMQTSLGVHNHRSSRRRTPGEVIHLPKGVKTVYQLMREAGYFVTTQGANKNDFNFIWDSETLYDLNKSSRSVGEPLWRKRPKGKPFFAQIQLRGGKNSGQYKGATPRDVAGEASAKSKKGKKHGGRGPYTDPAKMKVAPYYPDHPVMRREYAHHYDTIRQTDDEVGEIIDALKKDGLLNNTIVFFWTDHGLRLPRHKQWLYEGGIRVPLLVAGPGLNNKEVRNDLVTGIDITVSTLAMAGVKRQDWMEGRNVFVKGQTPREYVVSARDRCDYTIERVRAVTTKRFKYIRNFLTDRPFMQPQYRDGRDYVEVPRQLFKAGKLNAVQAFMWSPVRVAEEFYDLDADPHEIKNLADDPAFAAELKRHRAILQQWIKQTGDKGQQPEPVESLRGVYKRWGNKCVNPEYDVFRKNSK